MFAIDKQGQEEKAKMDELQEISVSDADDDFDDRYIHLSKFHYNIINEKKRCFILVNTIIFICYIYL